MKTHQQKFRVFKNKLNLLKLRYNLRMNHPCYPLLSIHNPPINLFSALHDVKWNKQQVCNCSCRFYQQPETTDRIQNRMIFQPGNDNHCYVDIHSTDFLSKVTRSVNHLMYLSSNY